MCGRFTLRARGEDLARLFELADVPLLVERYNVAPGQPVPAVRQEDGGPRTLALLRWGLVPSWSQARDRGAGPINARSETADTLPTFRSLATSLVIHDAGQNGGRSCQAAGTSPRWRRWRCSAGTP